MQHCLASKGWRIIIADESHTLRTSEKAPDARHTEAAVSAVRRSRRAIFLTGTPSLSRPFDLFRQVLPRLHRLSSTCYPFLAPAYPMASYIAACNMLHCCNPLSSPCFPYANTASPLSLSPLNPFSPPPPPPPQTKLQPPFSLSLPTPCHPSAPSLPPSPLPPPPCHLSATPCHSPATSCIRKA